MTFSRPDRELRAEFETVLQEFHPEADWLPTVARHLTGMSASTDFVALLDDGTRILRHWYHHGRTNILAINPEGLSCVDVSDCEPCGQHIREEIPDLLEQISERVDWVHPDYRQPPYPASYHWPGKLHPIHGRE